MSTSPSHQKCWRPWCNSLQLRQSSVQLDVEREELGPSPLVTKYGHGPGTRLTHKRQGQTVTEALSTPAAVRQAGGKSAESRKFQDISRELSRTATNADPPRVPKGLEFLL